jgi:mannitol/fructose-specific phosphotransferase system IIA component (Ntr-type)
MSTGMSRRAMPYAESDCLLKPVVAFGRSPTGIDFSAPDGLSVEFVFLFIVPPARLPDEQPKLQAMKSCAGVLYHRTLPTIRNCSTAQKIGDILNKILQDQ